jgi:hypothetical protein
MTKETGDELLREVLEMPDCTSSETLTAAKPVPHSLHNQRIRLINAEEISCRNQRGRADVSTKASANDNARRVAPAVQVFRFPHSTPHPGNPVAA